VSLFGNKDNKKNLNDNNSFTCPVCLKSGKVNDLDTCICNGKFHNSNGIVYVHGRCFNRQSNLCDDCMKK
jgi:RecJ-like exonuclease